MRPRLYLKAGDSVRHARYIRWGRGKVTEEKHSSLSGGFCLVKIRFEDGEERAFINDMDNSLCCYYAGVKLER